MFYSFQALKTKDVNVMGDKYIDTSFCEIRFKLEECVILLKKGKLVN